MPSQYQTVSILAQPGGRALPKILKTLTAQGSRFNPRPARGPGAARTKTPRQQLSELCFNPRPARGPGAAPDRDRLEPCDRSRFNPRPARGPGAATGPPPNPKRSAVSILAQPGGRALHRLNPGVGCKPQLFQSSPSPGAGRCGISQGDAQPSAGFNPRPARGPGAAPPSLMLASSVFCSFNPRPARGPGAAGAIAHAVGVERLIVSILAQPGGRALHLTDQ